MATSTGTWVKIAGEFPPTLVTNNPSRKLEVGETPNCTGISPTAEGYMQTSSIPTVDTANVRQYTVGGNVYEWHYKRLFRFSGAQVIYGAPDYTTVYYPQGDGYEDLLESSGSILRMLPLGGKDLAFMRASGTTVFVNANDNWARWFISDLVQEASIATASHACELDGDIYFVNTDGFYKLSPNLTVDDIGFDVSGDITPAAVTADYNKKLIRIGATHIYDVKNKKFLKYSGSTFVYETPELQINNQNITVTEVEIHYDATSDTATEIKFETQVENRGYNDDNTLAIQPEERSEVQSAHMQIAPDTGKTFQLKITTLPTAIKVTEIWVCLEGYVPESRDS